MVIKITIRNFYKHKHDMNSKSCIDKVDRFPKIYEFCNVKATINS